jgi:hypothetical protein
MSRTARPAVCLAGVAATIALVAAPAAARPDDPPKPTPAVQRVEVPVRVPVDDVRAEGIQMLVAAALGACAAGLALGGPRRRSRSTSGGGAPSVIDLTGTVAAR